MNSTTTQGTSAGGRLVFWRTGRGRWQIDTPAALLPVDVLAGEQRAALALANWLEEHVVDADGVPFPFDAEDVRAHERGWRSREGETLRVAVILARAEFDAARGKPDSEANLAARAIRATAPARAALMKRAHDGGYTLDRASRLARGDVIEFDVVAAVSPAFALTGDAPVPIGEMVTLRGTLVEHPKLSAGWVSLVFTRRGLTWATADGRQGRVVMRGWLAKEMPDRSWWNLIDDGESPATVILRRRHPAVEAAGIDTFETSDAVALGRVYGLAAEQLAALRATVVRARGRSELRHYYTRSARDSALDLREVDDEALNQEGMRLKARLDERAARERLDPAAIELRLLAAMLGALAAERGSRGLLPPSAAYLAGAAAAVAVRNGEADPGALSAATLGGAAHYARARSTAIWEWLSAARTPEIDADGAAWSSAASRLLAASTADT
jgi:hypothetical protein